MEKTGLLALSQRKPPDQGEKPGLLDGIRVLELCGFIAGPYCTRLLGDLGADVIKVEHPQNPDEARERPPFIKLAPDSEASSLFVYFNVNKRGVTIDIEQPEGACAFKDLVRVADVLVEDWPLGKLDDLGFGVNALRRINPSLVVTSISPFGRTGPRAGYQGAPLTVFHAGGEGYSTPMGACPSPLSAPTQIGRFVGERYAGLCASAATLAAVIESRATGMGDHVDVSKQHILPFLFQREMLYYLVSSHFPTRHTKPHKVGGMLRCKDGYICIMPRPESWSKIVELMGNPTEMEPYKDWGCARAAGETVNQLIEGWLIQHSRKHIFHILQRVGLSTGPCLSVAEAAGCEQFAARGLFESTTQGDCVSAKMPLVPYQINNARPVIKCGAPRIGEHDDLVHGELLGYSGARIVQMRQAGIVDGGRKSYVRVESSANPRFYLGRGRRTVHKSAGLDGRPGHQGREQEPSGSSALPARPYIR